MRYVIKIAYDGSRFNGFQKLNKYETVQGEMERALKKLFKKVIYVKGASRTDKGVHALKQTCHFDFDLDIECYKMQSALNHTTNKHIKVLDCKKLPEEFHSRFDAEQKTYIYKINLGEYNPIQESYVYNYNRKLDIFRMKKFSRYLLGGHNFKYFVSGVRENDNYDTIINSIKFKRKKQILEIEFRGKTFYQYMVRNLVGFLIEIGKGNYNLEDFEYIYNNKYEIVKYTCAPPNGLYLKDIKYAKKFDN